MPFIFLIYSIINLINKRKKPKKKCKPMRITLKLFYFILFFYQLAFQKIGLEKKHFPQLGKLF